MATQLLSTNNNYYTHNDINYIGKINKEFVKKESLLLFKKNLKNKISIDELKQVARNIQIKLNKAELTKEYIDEICNSDNDKRTLAHYIIFMARHGNFISKIGARNTWFTTNTTTLNQFLKEISKDTTIKHNSNLALLKLIEIMSLKIFSTDKLVFEGFEINFNKMSMKINSYDYTFKIKNGEILLTYGKEKYNLWLNKHQIFLIPLDKKKIVIKSYDSKHLNDKLLIKTVDEELSPNVKSFFADIIDCQINTASKALILGSSGGSIGREILAAIKAEQIQLHKDGLDSLIQLLKTEYECCCLNKDFEIFQQRQDISDLINNILDNVIFSNNNSSTVNVKLIFLGDSVFNQLTNNMPAHMYFRNILKSLNSAVYIKGHHDDVTYGFSNFYKISHNLFGFKNKKVIENYSHKLETGKFANLRLSRKILDQNINKIYNNCYYDEYNKKLYIRHGFRSKGIFNDPKIIDDSAIKLETAFGVFNLHEYDTIESLVNAINSSNIIESANMFKSTKLQIEHAATAIMKRFNLEKSFSVVYISDKNNITKNDILIGDKGATPTVIGLNEIDIDGNIKPTCYVI